MRKFGVGLGFVKSLSLRLAPEKIRVNAGPFPASISMLRDLSGKFWGNGQWQVRVEDEAGNKVCALTFSADHS